MLWLSSCTGFEASCLSVSFPSTCLHFARLLILTDAHPHITMLVLLRTLMRSASALRHSPSSSQAFHSSPARPLCSASAVALTSKRTALPPDNSHVLTLLEHSIAQRRPTQALTHLAQLQSPPEPQLLQKLAVLLARQKNSRGYALRAFEILREVYRTPGLKPDDYTKLASIYVMDACLRFRLLDSAMEVEASYCFMVLSCCLKLDK